MQPLSSDLTDDRSRPYFLWDEERTTGEFRQALAAASPAERYRLIGKLMREARDSDVWRFVAPAEVWAHFDEVRPYLGRRLAFWEYLLEGWRRDGFLA
ncbi:MAG: hypothetical protein ACREMB_07785 [Candidatus Rokuibacteriota bacterium]